MVDHLDMCLCVFVCLCLCRWGGLLDPAGLAPVHQKFGSRLCSPIEEWVSIALLANYGVNLGLMHTLITKIFGNLYFRHLILEKN